MIDQCADVNFRSVSVWFPFGFLVLITGLSQNTLAAGFSQGFGLILGDDPPSDQFEETKSHPDPGADFGFGNAKTVLLTAAGLNQRLPAASAFRSRWNVRREMGIIPNWVWMHPCTRATND